MVKNIDLFAGSQHLSLPYQFMWSLNASLASTFSHRCFWDCVLNNWQFVKVDNIINNIFSFSRMKFRELVLLCQDLNRYSICTPNHASSLDLYWAYMQSHQCLSATENSDLSPANNLTSVANNLTSEYKLVMLCTIWNQLYNLKIVKNTHDGVLWLYFGIVAGFSRVSLMISR